MGAASDSLLVPGGRRVVCGHAGGLIPHDPDFYLHNHSLVGVDLGGYPREVMEQFHLETQDVLTRLMAEGRYSPKVERRVAFDEVPQPSRIWPPGAPSARGGRDPPGRQQLMATTSETAASVRAWRVVRYGRPTEALELGVITPPRPGPGEILVRTSTSVCNYNEVDGCHGRYLTINPPLPYTLGMEFVGEVVAAGEGAEPWVGHRVMGTGTGAVGAHGRTRRRAGGHGL